VGNKERAREFKRAQDEAHRSAADEATLERIRTRPRPATEDVRLWGSTGARRLQLIVVPSFEGGRAWDVRELYESDWLLFGSDVVDFSPLSVKGLWKLPIESARLKNFYQRVTSIQLELGPPLEEFGGLDGTITQLAAFSGYSEWSFQWWSYFPPAWQPLTVIAEEMLAAFTAADAAFNDANSPPIKPE